MLMKYVSLIRNLGDTDTERFLRREEVIGEIKGIVEDVLRDIKQRKLEAILQYTKKFDQIELDENSLKLTEEDMQVAYSTLTSNQIDAIRESIKRVENFCIKQREYIKDISLETSEGTVKLNWLPLERIGIYAPAGRAPLPSSVIMASVPARIAGVKNILLCSPPQRDRSISPALAVAAKECGVVDVYKIGGSQAIGAMAYGCEIFPPVDMICGPGNNYVTCAKQLVSAYGQVKIDTVAGPSEVLIIADDTADPKIIANDMLAQAEHGETSASICITTSKAFAEALDYEIERQLDTCKEKEPMLSSLNNFGAILLAKNEKEIVSFSNEFAPEHLEIFTAEADFLSKKIKNSGAVFIRTGVVFGDYGFSGGNHILPTGRASRFASPVSVFSFMKQQQIESMSEKSQRELSKITAVFARTETLEAHARSAELRGDINE